MASSQTDLGGYPRSRSFPKAKEVLRSLSRTAAHSFRHAVSPRLPPGSVVQRPDSIRTVTLLELLRAYALDWLLVVLLLAAALLVSRVEPFDRVVTQNAIPWLRYPLKGDTVPSWALPIIALLVPVLAITGFFVRQRSVLDIHHAALGLFTAVFLTDLITNGVKVGVGRLRPDFLARCFPGGKEVFDATGYALCSGAAKVVREGRKSFPSGHSSYSAAGLGFLSIYLAGKFGIFDHEGHVWKLLATWLPLLAAALIGVSRTEDYKHHWTDVAAGLALGAVVAYYAYRQYFPSPLHVKPGVPFAFQDGDVLELAPLRRRETSSEVVQDGQHSLGAGT